MARAATKPERAGKAVDEAVDGAKRRRGQKHIDIVCEFAGASIGERTARLGAKVSRAISLEQADEYFVDRRLNVVVVAMPNGSRNDQGALPGMPENVESETVFSAVVDVKGFGVKPDYLSIGLTFNKREIDLATLSRCVNRKGKFKITHIEDIPEDEKTTSKQDEGDE